MSAVAWAESGLAHVAGDDSAIPPILGQNSDSSYNVQHYWVTVVGEAILLSSSSLRIAESSR